MTPAESLQQIQASLTDDPLAVIEQLVPDSPSLAIEWARRLPLWDDFRGQFPDSVIALARVISRRAMREHGLAFDAEGRVVEEKPLRGTTESKTFPIQLGDETVEVRYTRDYMRGSDLFSFVGQEIDVPPDAHPAVLKSRKPHALSESGWWSHFASHDAVEACGGPARYALRYAEARLKGEDKQFEEAFSGKRVEEKHRKVRREPAAEQAVVGQHTADAVRERTPVEPRESVRQGKLF